MDDNQDLSKQYQDILDRYSRELASAPVEETPQKISEETQSETQEALPQESDVPAENLPSTIESKVEEPKLEEVLESHDSTSDSSTEEQSISPPVTNQPVFDSTSTQSSDSVSSPTINFDSLQPEVKSGNSFFKFLFIVSLITFFGVLAAIVYTIFFQSNNSASLISNNPTPTTKVSVSPTLVTEKSCVVNSKQYKVGETFMSADGCNSCACTEDLTISCTNKACEATPSVKLVPTDVLKASPTSTLLVAKKQILPVDLVSVVKFNVKKDATTSILDEQIIIGDSILSGNFASVAYSIKDSVDSTYWLTKVGGSWQVVAGGQQPPLCTTLQKYSFPSTFSCTK